MKEDLLLQEEELQEEFAKIKLIVFSLGDEEYAMSITQLKEIVPNTKVTDVPLTNFFVKGVANVRGSIIPIIDLAKKFKLDDGQDDKKNGGFILVVETNEYKVGLWVKNVPSSLTVNENLLDEAPNIWNKDQVEQHYIKGIVKTDGRMIILIDVFQFMSSEIEEKLILN